LRRHRGQSILYVVLFIPTLMLILSLTVDVAQLQMQRVRLRYAVDLATLSGASSVDKPYYSQSARLRLDPNVALSTTRAYLASNLTEPLGSNQATAVAEAAEITVVNETPGIDPFTGMRLDRPSICARIRVPYRLDLLGFVGAIGTGQMTLASNAQIRP